MRETTPIKVRFTLSVDNSETPWVIERDLKLENIPGAWRIHGKEHEIPAQGPDRAQALLAFIAANYGPKYLSTKEMCQAAFDTLLARARTDRLELLLERLIKSLEAE